ncbi:hypothetical protein LINPERHAP1_LOCUS35522 [Linum perenne]
MDAYQHRPPPFIRPPPPPPSSDPNHFHHHHHPPPPPPQHLHPQQAPWYSNQYQFHQSPSPPPQQWAPPPPPPQHPNSSSYHHPPPHPYPPPPSYTPANQEWGNPNWAQHQGYQAMPPAHNNAEDWAARAKAWAASKNVAEDHQPPQQQPQFSDQGRFQEQYPQSFDPRYQDVQHHQQQQQQGYPSSGYPAPMYQPPLGYTQGPAATYNSVQQSSYGADGHAALAGAPTASPSVHEQEVPSSYSSFTGEGDPAQSMEHAHQPLPVSSAQEMQHHMQPSSVVGPSNPAHPPFAYGNQGPDPITNLSDQPLQFAPGFARDHDPHMQSNYAGVNDSWTHSVAASSVYPPAAPPGPQYDTSMAMPPVSGHSAPPFGSFAGSSFQPTLPSNGSQFGIGAGDVLHPPLGFAGDGYGVANISDRPKKASVPNWLKEEIIKNATVITRSSLENPKEGSEVIDDEEIDTSFRKGDKGDNKSIDSSRSTEEEEDDDEDEAEAAHAAAVNLEIKRILTEVLSKVTDELFDEIATKVLDEDNQAVEERVNVNSNRKVSPSPSTASTQKASAEVVVRARVDEPVAEDGEKSSSSAPGGNLLGLANYASDQDDDEIRSVDGGKLKHGENISEFNGDVTKKPGSSATLPVESIPTPNRDNKSSSLSKDVIKEAVESVDDDHRRQDTRHSRTERSENRNGSKVRTKDRGDGIGERGKESESRKRSSHHDVKEAKESEKVTKGSSKDDPSRKRERAKEKKEDRGRLRSVNESSRSKRRRSSSDSRSGVQEDSSHHHQLGQEGDKFRGHLITSILSAGILPTLLLRPAGGEGQDRNHQQGDTDDSFQSSFYVDNHMGTTNTAEVSKGVSKVVLKPQVLLFDHDVYDVSENSSHD